MTNEADKPGVRGFFKRLRAKLNQGPAWLTTDLTELLPGRKIDAEILDDLETRLITADVGAEATGRILAELRKRVARKELNDVDALLKALHDAMFDILKAVETPLSVDSEHQALRHPGGGNQRRRQDHDHRQAGAPAARGRTQRHAGRRRYLSRGGARTAWRSGPSATRCRSSRSQGGAEPAAVIFDALQAARARNIDVLIADTAGRLHTQTHLMDELKKVKRVLARLDPGAPHEVLLVLDGTIGQNAVAQAEEFNKGLGVTGLVVTKLDGTAKGGRGARHRAKAENSHPLRRRGRAERGLRRLQRVGVRLGAVEIRSRRRRRMIRFDQVHKRYATGREALSGVSFKIDEGELAFLTGHSGAGKSSILKLIALIERPTRGQVFIGNQNTARIKPRAIPQFRRGLGVVFQDHKLLHDRPVADNVALPLIIAGLPKREIDKRVRAALDQVGLLGKEKNRPLELSTGEQQRVGIARAVVAKPKLLIADEPTGNLDPAACARNHEALQALQ